MPKRVVINKPTSHITVAISYGDVIYIITVMLDGNNLGGALTAAPYSISWNTAVASNGSHTLTAVARDAAGNQASSAPVAVSVSNSVLTSFDFSLSNSGNVTAVQGQSASNATTVTFNSGTAQPVSFSASGLPSGTTGSFSPGSCAPNCTSTLSLFVSASTPTGVYPITVTGTSGSRSHTTSFTLTVTSSSPGVTNGSAVAFVQERQKGRILGAASIQLSR